MKVQWLGCLVGAAAIAASAGSAGCGSRCMYAADARPSNAGTGTVAGASAQRTLEEADIVQMDGDLLFAMSRTGGLSIVDASVPEALVLRGQLALGGKPFEMYRRGDVVFAMSNGAVDATGREVPPASASTSSSSEAGMIAPDSVMQNRSALAVAVDVSRPESPVRLSGFQVAGEIADTRLVGSVVYVVSQQAAGCYGCAQRPRTMVTSFDVSDARAPRKVEELAFAPVTQGYTWWKRSVAATPERLYVGAPDDAASTVSYSQSTIEVVDITDPSGHMKRGATVRVRGHIASRWQMDEHAGVLRVVSQYDTLWSQNGRGAPIVETFRVESADKVTPLGETELRLPKQEGLKAVRFDGPRAYAITFEQKDPLFTIDLSDPAAPRQRGELVMPGFVHHIEPRGDRLVALGVDTTSSEESLNVSLFDVSSLDNPRMLARVPFGSYGGLNALTEDQNRIHKAFRVFDAEGLVVVPYTTQYNPGYGQSSCTPSNSGVQLIDWSRNTLTRRALLPLTGAPRRAFVHDGRLLAVSDTHVRSFSLADRNVASMQADLEVSKCVMTQSFPQGDIGSFGEGGSCSDGLF